MKKELILKIEENLKTPYDDNLSLKGIPATDKEIEEAEKELNVKFHNDYIEYIKLFGGSYAGIDIYAFNNNEMMSNDTVVDLTKSFRTDYEDDYRSKIINKSYVFSFDDMGNPIMINKDENIIIFYHDSDEYEILTRNFSSFIEAMIEGKSLYEFN